MTRLFREGTVTYYAHSGPNSGDKSNWQTLKEHSLAVAEMAAALAEPLGLGRAAYVAGLLHDLGKYTRDFQRRLEGVNVPVDHSTAGAKLALGNLAAGRDKDIAELIAHGGVDRNIPKAQYDVNHFRRSLTGAWIETRYQYDAFDRTVVAPSRGRGSKR